MIIGKIPLNAKNSFANNVRANKPERINSPDLVNLDCLKLSSSNIYGKYMVFRSSLTAIRASRTFAETRRLSPKTIIPDGFKLLQYSWSTIDPQGKVINQVFGRDQITVIDRKKDEALQRIFRKYQMRIPEWKKEHQQIKRKEKVHKSWEDFLIQKTYDFIALYYRYSSSNDEKKIIIEQLEGNETFLGNIIESGVGVCRHNAFLIKLLMETQKIPVGCQAGFFNISSSDFRPHIWNYKVIKGKTHIIDINNPSPQKSDYQPLFNNNPYFV